MKLKRLFQVLVLGGSSLIAACGSDNPAPSNNTPAPGSLLPDGGTKPPGYTGPTIW